MAQNRFGYLNSAVDGTKIKETQSTECYNISPVDGLLDVKTFNRNSIDYKSKTTFYGSDRVYVIAGKSHGYTESNWEDEDGNSITPTAGDLYRLAEDYNDSTNPVVEKVGVEDTDYLLTSFFDAVRDNQIVDTSEKVFKQADTYLENNGNVIGTLDKGDATLRIVPYYDITIDTGSETFSSAVILKSTVGDFISISENILGRSGIYISNLPTYSELVSLIDNNNVYNKELSGEPIFSFSTGYDFSGGFSDIVSGTGIIAPDPQKFTTTDKTVSDYDVQIDRIRLFLAWDIDLEALGRFQYQMEIYDTQDLSVNDDFPVNENNSDNIPDLYYSSFNSDDLYNTSEDAIFYLDPRLLEDYGTAYSTKITFNDEDIPTGERQALYTVGRTTLYDFQIESTGSDITRTIIYANQQNDDLQYTLDITDTVTVGSDADGTYYQLDSSNPIIKVYRKSKEYPSFYLLSELDLEKKYFSDGLSITLYSDADKTTEVSTPYSDNVVDGNSYYIDILLTDTNKDISTNETYNATKNNPPDEMKFVLTHKQQIFYVNKNFPNELYISEVGEADYYAKSGSNVITFDYDIIGLEKYDEVMYIATEKELYILWGNTADDFVVKVVNPDVNIFENSMLGTDIGVLFTAEDGIYLVNRKNYKKISSVINDKFDDINSNNYKIANVDYKDNRYYVLEVVDTIADDNLQYMIIFDVQYQGFFRGDTTKNYYYKTKRYDFQGTEINETTTLQANELKNIYQIDIEYNGDIDIEIYKDGTNTYTKNITSTGRTHKRLWIDKIPFYDFAVRFVFNNTSSEIYNWEILRFRG